MNKTSSLLLQFVIFITGLGSLAFLLLTPLTEGRNVNATLFQVYFNDPFLAYAYLGSIPFFFAMYKAFMLLGKMGQGNVRSADSARALGAIKYGVLTTAGFVVAGIGYLAATNNGQDDIAGAVAMALMVTVVFAAIGTTAAVLQKRVLRAV